MTIADVFNHPSMLDLALHAEPLLLEGMAKVVGIDSSKFSSETVAFKCKLASSSRWLIEPIDIEINGRCISSPQWPTLSDPLSDQDYKLLTVEAAK